MAGLTGIFTTTKKQAISIELLKPDKCLKCHVHPLSCPPVRDTTPINIYPVFSGIDPRNGTERGGTNIFHRRFACLFRNYVKALDAQVFKDINTGATVATLAVPVGAVGNMLAALGPASSVAAGYVEGKTGTTVSKEILQLAAAQYLSRVYGLGDAVVNRITATVDLAGGWQAFIDRVKNELPKEEK